MKRLLLAVSILGCSRPPTPAEPSQAATASAEEPDGPLPPALPPDTEPSPSEAELDEVDEPVERVASTGLPRCLPSQLNTPCVYERGGMCLERRSNCDRVPCSEMAGPHPSHPPEVCAQASAPTSTGCDIAIRCSVGLRDLVPCKVAPTCGPRSSGACISEKVAARILAANSCAEVDPIVRTDVR